MKVKLVKLGIAECASPVKPVHGGGYDAVIPSETTLERSDFLNRISEVKGVDLPRTLSIV